MAEALSARRSARLVMAGVRWLDSLAPDDKRSTPTGVAGRKDRRIAARAEDGYVSGQWKYGELAFGRVGRNWGPPTLYGLQLGNYAYTYDHLYGLIGNESIHFSTVIARLNSLQLANGDLDQRYFSIKRLSFRRGRWEVAGTESFVYTGVGRGFEPSLANPFNILGLSWRNENQDGNFALGAEAAYRSGDSGRWPSLFIDDFQIDRSIRTVASRRPTA